MRDQTAAAFEAFYAHAHGAVYHALVVTLGDADLAREAVDEAMARAYLHWARIAEYDNPAGWVYRVGLNWAASWWRKIRRERPIDGAAGLAAAVEDVEALALLTELPRPQRAVVVCRVLLQLSTAETAAALGIAEGTVKSRLARALTALRADLTEVCP
jgi:RNA polymerase sigma-70 factor (ECF subfamily)